jgi:hypothetical protein
MKQSNILIYSMGRVGSVTTRKALSRKGVQALHVHHLFTPEGRGEPGFGGPRLAEVERWLDRSRQVKVVSLIRDPMYRSISSWLIQKKPEEMCLWSLEKARKLFLQENRLKYTLKWSDNELSRLLNMDVLAFLGSTSFRRIGHHRFHHGGYDVLIMRTDKLDNKSAPLSQIVGRTVEIKRENVSANRPRFAEEYARIVEGLVFSKDFVDEVYNSKLVLSSFTRDHIEEMKENWL